MTYREQYYQIIDFRRQNPVPDNEYSEKHHIIPKSCGGTNDPDNLVRLTAAEHYKAHCILPYMYLEEGNKNGYTKMLYAWHRLANSPQTSHPNLLFVDEESEEYEKLRKAHKELLSGKIAWNRGISPDETTRKKISDSLKGKRKGVSISEEHKRKIGEANKVSLKGHTPWNKGMPVSETQKEKQRISMRGKLSGSKHPLYGTHRSEDVKQRLSESIKGRHIYNNGIVTIMAYECPEGFVPGRIPRK